MLRSQTDQCDRWIPASSHRSLNAPAAVLLDLSNLRSTLCNDESGWQPLDELRTAPR